MQSPLTFATPGTKSMPGDAASAGAATSVMRSDATPARETVYATAPNYIIAHFIPTP